MSLLEDIDFDSIRDEIAEIIEDSLEEVVDAAREDLTFFARRMAENLLEVVRLGDDRLLRSLKGQARMLAEVNRIRLNREARALLNRVLDVAARVGKVVLTAAIAAV